MSDIPQWMIDEALRRESDRSTQKWMVLALGILWLIGLAAIICLVY